MSLNLHNPKIEEAKREIRLHWKLLLALAIILVVAFVGLSVYVNTDSFRERVRRGVVASLERSSGGRTEVQKLDFSFLRRTVVIENLTIHGTEGPNEAPFVHVDRLWAKIKIRSIFSRDFALEQVSVDHPTVHYIIYPDGKTNQPQPARPAANADPVQELFSLALEHAESTHGLFILNEQRIPLDLKTDNVTAHVSYDQRDHRFDGRFTSENLEILSPAIKPIHGAVDATLSVYPDHAQLQALTARTGNTTLKATGTITRFLPANASFDYQASVDLADFAKAISWRELRGGHADLGGILVIGEHRTSSKGKVAIQNAEYRDPNVTLRGLNGGSDFTYYFEPSRLDLPHIFLHGLGGVVQGNARIESWLGGHEPGAPKEKNVEHGRADLHLTGISAEAFATAASSRELPLDKLRPAGRIDGDLNAAWTGSLTRAVTQLDLQATPERNLRDGQLPITGFLHGSYNSATNVLSMSSSSVNSPASHLAASGDLGTKTSSLRVTASTSNVNEVMPFIAAVRGGGKIPVELGGNASFRGTINGPLRNAAIAGHVEAANFETEFPASLQQVQPSPVQAGAAPAAPPKTQRVHWDSLVADFGYSADKLTVSQSQLRRGNTVATLSGFMQLTKGEFTNTNPFQAHVVMTRANVAEIQSILGLDYPVTGVFDLNLDVSGTRNNLAGGGNLKVADGTAYGQPFRSFASSLAFEQNQVHLRNATLLSDLGTVTGNTSYNMETRAFTLDLHGHDFRVERFAFANRPHFHAAGAITFDATGTGTLDAPVINANARLSGLTINRQQIGSLNIDAVTHGAELQLTARSNMQHASIVMDGSVHLRGDMPGHAVLTVTSTDLDPLIAAFVPIRISGPTQLESRVEINGPFRNPHQLSAAVKIDRLSTELEGIGVYNAGAISLRVANEVLTIERFRLAGEGNRFLQVRGSAELAGQQRLDFAAEGDINLKLIQSANPNLIASGYSDFNVTVNGTINNPLINGRLNFHNGALAFLDLPNGLSEINGTVFFNQDRAQIQKLVGRTGGGYLDLGGFVSYERGVAFNLTATGQDIRIRYPQGVSSTATANLTLVGNLRNSVLAGDVTVTRFGLNPQFDFAYYLGRSKEPAVALYPSSPLANVRLDVHVVSTPELQVQTTLAKVSGNVDLHVRGTGAHPVILGHINIVEGKVDFNGTTYTLERGDITFSNPVTIDPILDVEASAHVRDYDITLGFHGSPLQNKLTTSYRSDPPLQPGDIIALLALGRTREEAMNASTVPGSQQQVFSDTTSNALLGEAINATISNRVQKIFGVSRIKIDPQVAGVENSGYARLTVDQQISNKVTLTYITNLSQSAQQIIQFEYNVNKNVSIIAVRDQNGIVSFDVRLRQRKR